jgi:hypothetical protein
MTGAKYRNRRLKPSASFCAGMSLRTFENIQSAIWKSNYWTLLSSGMHTRAWARHIAWQTKNELLEHSNELLEHSIEPHPFP